MQGLADAAHSTAMPWWDETDSRPLPACERRLSSSEKRSGPPRSSAGRGEMSLPRPSIVALPRGPRQRHAAGQFLGNAGGCRQWNVRSRRLACRGRCTGRRSHFGRRFVAPPFHKNRLLPRRDGRRNRGPVVQARSAPRAPVHADQSQDCPTEPADRGFRACHDFSPRVQSVAFSMGQSVAGRSEVADSHGACQDRKAPETRCGSDALSRLADGGYTAEKIPRRVAMIRSTR